MRKRDRNRQWHVQATFDWGCDNYMEGDQRSNQRLKEVQIGEWLKVTLIEGKKGRKEQYRVQFGDEVFVVSIKNNGDPDIRLQWGKSLVDANPVNISGGKSR